jgi:hypothetical protein
MGILLAPDSAQRSVGPIYLSNSLFINSSNICFSRSLTKYLETNN